MQQCYYKQLGGNGDWCLNVICIRFYGTIIYGWDWQAQASADLVFSAVSVWFAGNETVRVRPCSFDSVCLFRDQKCQSRAYEICGEWRWEDRDEVAIANVIVRERTDLCLDSQLDREPGPNKWRTKCFPCGGRPAKKTEKHGSKKETRWRQSAKIDMNAPEVTSPTDYVSDIMSSLFSTPPQKCVYAHVCSLALVDQPMQDLGWPLARSP